MAGFLTRIANLSPEKRGLLVRRLDEAQAAGKRKMNGGEGRLVAYIVCAGQDPVSPEDLRRFLGTQLPAHMIPSAFIKLEAMPLTPNGKVDRRALPTLGAERPELERGFMPPETDVERIIASIWREALSLEAVGTNDNFFDLGGHSLLMVRVHSKLREMFKTDLSIVDLFRYPTIKSLARSLKINQAEPLSFETVNDRAAKQRAAIARSKTGPSGSQEVQLQ
ncbi:MAG: phosphopantetheine-binding protein [Bryobacteraceae bacterium]